jgi:hypothetical protein
MTRTWATLIEAARPDDPIHLEINPFDEIHGLLVHLHILSSGSVSALAL